jgi:hypothetical protein
MKKLKLEDLVVTSFETAAATSARGTVLGAGRTDKPGCVGTYGGCAETEYFDCTLGCSRMTDCPYSCVE